MTNITIENIIMTTKWSKIYDNLSSGLAIRSFINRAVHVQPKKKRKVGYLGFIKQTDCTINRAIPKALFSCKVTAHLI